MLSCITTSLTINDTVEENVPVPPTDDGTGPEKMALIMGPPDRCEHAASIITDLLQSVRAREEGGQVSTSWSSVLKLRSTSWVERCCEMGETDEICLHRGPQVLVLECHREVRDMGGARAAGGVKWPSPFPLTNAGLLLAEEEKMSSPSTNRRALS